MHSSPDTAREMGLPEQIEYDPAVSQATLAARLDVAVGTVNWHLKRLIAKGYVKVKRAERRKLKYIITPEGIAFRARLTFDYIEQSMMLYRNTRLRVRELLADVQQAGFHVVRLDGDVLSDQANLNAVGKGNATSNDILDICRLTCLELGVQLENKDDIPCLQVRGLKVSLWLPGKKPLEEAS